MSTLMIEFSAQPETADSGESFVDQYWDFCIGALTDTLSDGRGLEEVDADDLFEVVRALVAEHYKKDLYLWAAFEAHVDSLVRARKLRVSMGRISNRDSHTSRTHL